MKRNTIWLMLCLVCTGCEPENEILTDEPIELTEAELRETEGCWSSANYIEGESYIKKKEFYLDIEIDRHGNFSGTGSFYKCVPDPTMYPIVGVRNVQCKIEEETVPISGFITRDDGVIGMEREQTVEMDIVFTYYSGTSIRWISLNEDTDDNFKFLLYRKQCE